MTKPRLSSTVVTSWPSGAPISAGVLPTAPALPRIKVLHVVARLAGGGGTNVVLSVLGADRDRYDMWIFGGDRGSEDAQWEAAAAGGIRTVISAGMGPDRNFADIASLFRLVRLIRRERFTIVHTHSRKAGVIGGVAARVCRVPIIVHSFHTRIFAGSAQSPPYGRLERLIGKLAHAYIAISPTLARQAIEKKTATPGRIKVIASGVDIEAIPSGFDPDARAALGVPRNVTLIGTVGRIAPEKAHDDFVHMATQIHDTHPETAFAIIGDGPRAAKIRSLAAELGIEVIMTGYRPDADRLIAGIDIFVMTSLREGLGRVLIEALASARPCVATAVDGIPDLIRHGVTGLLSEPGNPSSTAHAVRWMIDNPGLAARMAQNGRRCMRHPLTPFTSQAMCAAIDAYYRDLLGIPEQVADASVGKA
jgi:glycosyltransferase involved in cell wall biosynthesis